jgi:hypothetical protein
MNADMIVAMDKGKVVEFGNHQTLISADDGVYSRMFHLQSNMKDWLLFDRVPLWQKTFSMNSFRWLSII